MTTFSPRLSLDAVAVDTGSISTRAGFSGEDTPRVVCESAIGHIDEGLDAQSTITDLENVSCALEHKVRVERLSSGGADASETVLRALLQRTFKRLGVTPAEWPLLLSEPPLTHPASRRRIAEVLFEDFGVPALSVVRAPELAAVSSGRSTAVVVDLGGSTSASAVVDGMLQPRSVFTSELSMPAVSKLFAKHVAAKGVDLSQPTRRLLPREPFATAGNATGVGVGGCGDALLQATNRPGAAPQSASLRRLRDEQLLREAFESVAIVQEKGHAESTQQATVATEFTLPDGRVLSLGDERSAAAECLFKEQPDRPESQPLQALVLQALGASEADQHRELLKNVVVCGGGACLPGLPERLDAELRAALPECTHLPTVANQAHRLGVFCGSTAERMFAVWLGGSILASFGGCYEIWMSRAEYAEHGAGLISRKGLNYLNAI